MSEEVKLVYMNLNQLLDDICKFLKDGVNRDALSSESRKQADNLIRRSKVQLQKISIIIEDFDNGDYMDMQKKITEKEIIQIVEEPKNISNNNSCPYAELPAKDLPLKEKCGYISWKTKFIFGFEKHKRIYAGINNEWLLIYNNERDSKPSQIYNLKKHKAQILVLNKQIENKSQNFCLINIETQCINQFMAQTHKDMLQWVAKINKTYHLEQKITTNDVNEKEEDYNIRSISSIDDEDDAETYDTIIVETHKPIKIETKTDIKTEDTDEEELYIDIEYRPPPEISKAKIVENLESKLFKMPIPPKKMPKLPNKVQQTPLPPVPIEKESSESLASYDAPIETDNLSLESHNSFSEESEEDIYNEVIMPPLQNDQPDENINLKHEISPSPSIKTEETFIGLLKPSLMPKPKIDVKIIKHNFHSKTTKQILKLAKERSVI